jgi:hypothetical protein
MEFYDSPEAEEESKSIAKKIDALHDFFKDMSPEETKAFFEKITTSLELLHKAVEDIKEKAKYEPLNKEEKKFLRKVKKDLKALNQKFEDTMLLLSHSLVMQANDYMVLLKQEAAKGNAEAKKVYDELYPSYKAALEEEASDPELMN